MHKPTIWHRWFLVPVAAFLLPGSMALAATGDLVPTGARITPEAAKGAVFEGLNPDLVNFPNYLADHAVKTAISPDGNTMLVLTSGYNRMNGPTGSRDPESSKEYVFVYDIRGGSPRKVQVLQVPNTFNGIAWSPAGDRFYVSGGVDDNVHLYHQVADAWVEDGSPIPLGHDNVGLGIGVRPLAAGIAVNGAGNRLLVANYENDSVSLIDLDQRAEVFELDLRPGLNDPGQSGVPGGEYPFAVLFKGNDKAYVTSQRDREIVVLKVEDARLSIQGRISLAGQPNHILLNRAGNLLYVACDNSDTVAVIDTASGQIREEFLTTAPARVFPNPKKFKGSNPNGLALSPDERTLFVTNGGTNSVAVVRLGRESTVLGLIPTGWYPNHVSVSANGTWLYVVNGKDNAGPNPDACRDRLSTASGSSDECNASNQYVWQLHKAGLLSLPLPDSRELSRLTWQVAFNNNFPRVKDHQAHAALMQALRERIQHVIYVVKENRTYDQVMGALPVGNGDPELAILAPYSPNHLAWGTDFVLFDNFYDSGETSNTGWNWTTAARTTDFTEKTAPVNYAGRGLTYDWEGTNRNINVGLPTPAERIAANPYNPDDPDLLPGTGDVAAPDSPEGEAGTGYLWDAALRAGLSVRNYGFYGDLALYFVPQNDPNFIALSRYPFAEGVKQFIPTKQSLIDITDPYFRGYDMKYPDYWRYKEWEREFEAYVANENLPNLMLVRMPHDHFGDYSTAIDRVNTVETQMANNDYAVGLLIEKVANSPYKDKTLIFIIEDDAQNGGDHVDAHRSIGYIVGPYVKQGAVVSEYYTTVSMLRTIEDVLGMEPMGINDGLAEPMALAFDLNQKDWTYQAILPEILCTNTDLKDYDAALAARCIQLGAAPGRVQVAQVSDFGCYGQARRSAAYWAKKMQGQDFTGEDRLDAWRFNRDLWDGLRGENTPEPLIRHGRDLRQGRAELLKAYQAKVQQECSALAAAAR
jgi:DNA-binding beta-propeller fold protein YncE